MVLLYIDIENNVLKEADSEDEFYGPVVSKPLLSKEEMREEIKMKMGIVGVVLAFLTCLFLILYYFPILI